MEYKLDRDVLQAICATMYAMVEGADANLHTSVEQKLQTQLQATSRPGSKYSDYCKALATVNLVACRKYNDLAFKRVFFFYLRNRHDKEFRNVLSVLPSHIKTSADMYQHVHNIVRAQYRSIYDQFRHTLRNRPSDSEVREGHDGPSDSEVREGNDGASDSEVREGNDGASDSENREGYDGPSYQSLPDHDSRLPSYETRHLR